MPCNTQGIRDEEEKIPDLPIPDFQAPVLAQIKILCHLSNEKLIDKHKQIKAIILSGHDYFIWISYYRKYPYQTS